MGERTRRKRALSLSCRPALAIAVFIFGILLLGVNILQALALNAGDITTVAGNGNSGYSGDGRPATSAELDTPNDVAVDASGNIYIADTWNYRIRKVDTNGTITTVAGNGTSGDLGDGVPATSASFSGPSGMGGPTGVAVDASGNIYIADNNHYRVRKVDTSGTITTVAGYGISGYWGDNGPATSAYMTGPTGVAVDASGNIYIADTSNSRIRKVDTNGTITTVAGNGTSAYSGDGGPATSAALDHPTRVAVDASGNIYIADTNNHRIRKVDTNGTITTVAGNDTSAYSGDGGLATSAALNNPNGVAVNASGNIYIADTSNSRIREVAAGAGSQYRINMTAGNIYTVAGSANWGYSGDNGPATSAKLRGPSGVAVDASGNIYIADVGNSRIRKVTALPSVTIDTDFNPNPIGNGNVLSIAVQADGKILIGGNFTTIGSVTRNRIARLDSLGNLDQNFDPNANKNVHSIAVQDDKMILVGGYFTTIGSVTRNRIARLDSLGNLDQNFNPNASGGVHSIAVQADGNILVGGWFTTIGGGRSKSIARLKAQDGSLDTSFVNPKPNSGVHSIAVQADGKILVGGNFTTIGGVARSYIARLDPNGTLDPSFTPPTLDKSVASIVVQADGNILVGGYFTTIGGVARGYIARLTANGTLDPSFTATADSYVLSIIPQADGKILVGGYFRNIGGGARRRVARLNAQDGTLDTTFRADANNSVEAIAVQADGKVLVGGFFSKIGGVARPHIARLTNTDAALQELTVSLDGKTVTWMRGLASPEVWRVTFEQSTDGGVTWKSLGSGTRITGGWQLSGLSLVLNQNHYVRARGCAAAGGRNGSESCFESIRLF